MAAYLFKCIEMTENICKGSRYTSRNKQPKSYTSNYSDRKFKDIHSILLNSRIPKLVSEKNYVNFLSDKSTGETMCMVHGTQNPS